MPASLTTQEQQFIQTGSTMALTAYGNTPQGDGWVLLNDPSLSSGNTTSGFQAQTYINPTTQQIWVAVAGTNDMQDVAAWGSAVTGWSLGAQQFTDGIDYAASINNLVRNNPQYADYTISTSGHSFGEGFAQMFAYTFGWAGVGFDGIGAGAIIDSAGFSQYLASQNITAVGGTNFISCNTAGLFDSGSLLNPGGGLVGSIGSDIQGTRSCTVNVDGGWVSGIVDLALGFVGGPLGYASGEVLSGIFLHSMENVINPAIQSGNFTVSSTQSVQSQPLSVNDYFDIDNTLSQLNTNGLIETGLYNSYNDLFSNWLVNTAPTQQIIPFVPGYNPNDPYGFGPTLDPIGAFYETVTPVNDLAPSIADKTHVLRGATNQNLTVSALTARDANADGMLSGAELDGLNVWADLNENGHIDTNELKTVVQAGITQINSADYGFYTKGNAVAWAGVSAEPARPDELVGVPVRVNLVQAVPSSNYRTLRNTDNTYVYTAGGYIYTINWAPTQIKINHNNRSYLIGTDGADVFDANYYNYAGSPFNNSLLTNFLAGGGNDTFGGSANADNLWGGTGDDTAYGYAGNDKLYGEEGNDTLVGQDGNDYMDGGIGDDFLYGGLGSDVGNGGAGNDLVSGNEGDDSVYGGAGLDTLYGGDGNDYLDGGADNDLMFGEAGDDTLFGGVGADELQGGDGNDQLLGEDGNDKLFGQTGDDVLRGGAGDDVLVGFTPSNDPKQSLLAGETDNDTLFGGAGMDNLYGGLGDDLLDGGTENDLLVGNEGIDSLFGGDGNDELQGGDGNDKLMGEAGNDKLFGQTGNDTLWGGDGNDILIGFTGSNEAKQTLNAGESDNDILYGGAGNDFVLGGLGVDKLYGESGMDELQGGDGNDYLYGGADDDRLFGQTGNDVLYGGDGNDILIGFTGNNETKQTLNAGETDNDKLYGGAGSDILFGGLGSDYLDGGAGADFMEGGLGNDTYIVNSVNDSILERTNEGYDTVVSSTNYILNAEIEELRLVEGLDIHGTGNALNNTIIGNSHNNILDGVTGADMMIGGAGDDTYYVDDTGDQAVELASEGTDTVQSSISYTLAGNLENLVLLDFSKPEKGLMDGQAILVYGYPKRNELDYMQGNAVLNYQGTCALTAIANLLTQSDRPTTEADVVQLAIDNNWAVTNPSLPAYQRGGSNYVGQQAILDSYGVRNDLLVGYNEQGVANLVRSGRGVIIGVNAGVLWDDPSYTDYGSVNHVVTVTGAAYLESDGSLAGFYIADSGRGKVSDMTRFVSIDKFRLAANVASAYAIFTLEPLKLWDENIDGTGNDFANVLIGNRGDNVLSGGAGNDMLEGGGGNDTIDGGSGVDTLLGGLGNDTYVVDVAGDVVTENLDEGTDTVQSAISYILGTNVENLTLTGTAVINGTGNALNNVITGNAAANTLNGGSGADTMQGGAGNDTYVVDDIGDVVTESASQGSDTVKSSVSYTLGANLENLTLTGTSAINGTGNSLGNILTGNAGNNVLNGGGGSDWVYYDSATSAVSVNLGLTTAQDTVGAGVDTLLNIEHLSGSKYDDYLVGNASGNALRGGAGNDILDGGAGTDWAFYSNATSGVTVDLNITTAQDTHGAGVDTLLNIEWLYGSAYADTLIGNTLDNRLDGAGGADTMKGGLGNDTYVVNHAGDVVTESLNEGADIVQSSISYTLGANVENLTLTGTVAINGTGNTLNNIITGNAAANVLNGAAGADTLTGGTGNDTYVVDNVGDIVSETSTLATEIDSVQSSISYTLGANVENLTLTGTAAINGYGNTLSNTLIGNAAGNALNGGIGADIMVGGTGNDTYYVDNIGDQVIENQVGQTFIGGYTYVRTGWFGRGYYRPYYITVPDVDFVNASVSYTLGANVENLTLTGAAAINGTGNALNNIITGNTANNVLNGGVGNDLMMGGAGADSLTGGAGNELLSGGVGNDTITTGEGADIIAFNRGDGADIVNKSIGTDNTIALGGGIAYADLALSKVASDLVIEAGNGEQITLKSWYDTTANYKSVLNLQMVAEAMAGFDRASADPLLNQSVQNFDFTAIVNAFDQAHGGSSTYLHWGMTNELLAARLGGSDLEALGGDLAYQYGVGNATLSGVGPTSMQDVLSAAQFGNQVQGLQPLQSLAA